MNLLWGQRSAEGRGGGVHVDVTGVFWGLNVKELRLWWWTVSL